MVARRTFLGRVIIRHELQRNKMGNPTPAGPAGLASWRECARVPAPILVQNDRPRRHRYERRKPADRKFIRATKSRHGLDDNTRLLAVLTPLDEHAVRLRVVASVQDLGDDARPARGLRAPRDGVDGLVRAHLVLFVWSSACSPVLGARRRAAGQYTGVSWRDLCARARRRKSCPGARPRDLAGHR